VDFWVTVATVLPVLGLPLVLTARAQIGHALRQSARFARFTAGNHALTLVLIYIMEIVAIVQLAESASGSDLLKYSAALVVGTACGSLIFSHGVFLFWLTFGGRAPILGRRARILRLRITLTLAELRTQLMRHDSKRRRRRINAAIVKRSQELDEAWDRAIRDGFLVFAHDEDSPISKWWNEYNTERESLSEAFLASERYLWFIHYSREGRKERRKQERKSMADLKKEIGEQTLRSMWDFYNEWSGVPKPAPPGTS
jgi:hypothetical protein